MHAIFNGTANRKSQHFMDFALEIQILDGGRIYMYVYIYIYYAYILSWIARVVFLARTLLCVRAEKEKKKKNRFFPFFAGKRYAETKKPACVRAEKDFFFSDFSRFSRGKGMQKQKKTRVRSGRERKKENFSTFPVFREEKVCRNKKNTRAFEQRKKKRKFFDLSRFSRGKDMQKKKCNTCVGAEKEKKKKNRFFPFFAGKRSVETIKK